MRLHLFEWHDQRWFPVSLKAAMTSYLVAAYGITPFPKAWANCLSKLMSRDVVTEIVDLGSRAGGPVERVIKELGECGFKARITLTDLYPNLNGLQFRADGASSVRYWPEPVDAARVPVELSGVRTMFASFHHFRPQAAREILRDAFEQRHAICIFRRNIADAGCYRIGVAHSFACSGAHAFGEAGILGSDSVHISCADLACVNFLGRSGFAASNIFSARVGRVHAGSSVTRVPLGSGVD